MASKTEIANLAISHLGKGKEIANIETEKSEEAAACRRFYETAKEATLSDHDWSFASKRATLNLIASNPNDEWDYSYRYPVDCLSVRRIIGAMRFDTEASEVKYKIEKDDTGLLIFSDQANAVIEYTENISDPQFFSAEFTLALSFRLASYIAPRLTGGDPFNAKQEMLAQYILELGNAKKKTMNEEKKDLKPPSEFIRYRS
jgi:hypothetical protein